MKCEICGQKNQEVIEILKKHYILFSFGKYYCKNCFKEWLNGGESNGKNRIENRV